MILKYSVGLDISSKDFKAAICTIDTAQVVKVKSSATFGNTKRGFEKLLLWIKTHHKEPTAPLVLCMEATGVYHENCALFCHFAGIRVSIILPNKAKRYLQSLGLKSKNDSIDARGLAQMGAEQALTAWEPMDGYFYTLRHLTRQRQSLQEQKTASGNQLHAVSFGMHRIPFVIKQLKAHLLFLDKQIKALDKAIEEQITSNTEVAAKVKNISKIKGLATLSIATVLAETGGFELFNNYKQVVSYAGYDVVENQSGKHSGKTKISKKGNSHIRRILHMPALTAKGSEPIMVSLYERTLARHGIKMKSIVAVQKKLLLMIYYMYKKEMDYETYYQKNIQEKEQEPASGVSTPSRQKKVASNKVEATQGKHPTNDRSMPPLGKTKLGIL